MFGIVLWSDTDAEKAIIWCEDQGDLAIYRSKEGRSEDILNKGDLVQFDLSMDRTQRIALNPKVIAEDYHSDLPEELKATAAPATPVQPVQQTAEVIPFAAFQAAASRRDAPAKAASLA